MRVTPFVKPSAILTQVTWGTLGFTELHYRAANSRYMAGQENPDCADVSRAGPNGARHVRRASRRLALGAPAAPGVVGWGRARDDPDARHPG